MATADLIVLIAALLGSALCSGLEIAIVSGNKLYTELHRKQGTWWARLIGGILERPQRLIGTLLLGNNIALVIFGIVMARTLEPWLLSVSANEVFLLLAQTAISTIIVLVFAEFLPKALFRVDPNGALALFAVPLRAMYLLLWLPMMLMTGISEGLLRLFGVKGKGGQVAFGRVDLDDFLKEISESQSGQEDLDAEVEYFRNTLALSSTKARDLIVPRAEIEAIDVEESVEVLHQRFVRSGLSKMLVYRRSIDNIIGYVHGYEMFRRPRSIRSILRPVDFIPGTMPADQVLQMFTKQRSHVAVVVDEFGGTAGMLTIEDAVETIVGDIEDEHDEGDPEVHRIGDHHYAVSARTEVSHLSDELGLQLPQSDEYETLAGYLLHLTGEIPEEGAVIEEGPFRFTVSKVVHSRIDKVRIEVIDTEKGYKA
ncbi:MAG: HlyC/CorC family transporter [Flavobacteriales bacterium]|nr:HlyC/CorC family transporter [Flavobacteriales bacterium]